MAEQEQNSRPKKSTEPEPVPSTSKASNLSRLQRNVAEKQRRDKLNGYISELANIVPMVSMSSKRLDKTSILRLSAAHLRLSKSPLSGTKRMKKTFKWCPHFLSPQQVREILESVDGFLIVTSSSGKILFVSSSVERYLGHQNIDMIGHSLFLFVHPDDIDPVKEEMEKLLTASLNLDDSETPPRCSFRCRMKEKGQPRSEVATYQCVNFAGDMTIADDENVSTKKSNSTAIVTHIFKAFVRVVDANPYNQLSLEEATADEYLTRHSLDGTIIFADHRLSTITGHLPHEVIGLSAYEYILPEDTSVALFAHHLMFSSDKGTGMIVYRLRTRDEKFVYLKTVGCLQFDRATSQVDHFVCVNQYLTDAEGESQLKYFVDRFIPHIKDSSAVSLFESVKALQAMGMKAPSSFGALNEGSTFNRLSTSEHSQVSLINTSINSKICNDGQSNKELKSTTCIIKGISSESTNHSRNIIGSNLNTMSELSSSKKVSYADKSVGTDRVLPSGSLDFQKKSANISHNDIDCVKKKRKVVCSTSINTSVSNIVNNSNIQTHSSSQLKKPVFALPKVPKHHNISPRKIHPLNGLNTTLQSQNISITNDAVDAINSIKSDIFNVKQKNLPSGNFSNDSITGGNNISQNYNGQTVSNPNYIQMQVPELPSLNHRDNSIQGLPHTDNTYNGVDHIFINSYDIKFGVDSVMPNSSNVYSMSTETFSDIKTNILLSTGSVSYTNDMQLAVPNMLAGNITESTDLSNIPFVVNKINLNGSTELSINVNDLHTEPRTLSSETSSKSSASNAVCEKPFTPPIESGNNVQNISFIQEDQLKDNFVAPEDITAILNSTMQFEDSSLPSVDGWSQFFRPEDILNDPNIDIVMHIEGGESLINSLDEKTLNL